MGKIKEFVLNHKKLLIILLAVVLVAGMGLGGYFLFREKPTTQPSKTGEKVIENTYTMYVKINPLVKLTLKETYVECTDDNGKKYACGATEDSVIGYDLINDDAKEVYDELDFTGKSVLDVLVMLCDTARENDIGFEKLEISSDWNNVYSDEEILEYIQENGHYEHDVFVYVDFTEHPESSDILEDVKKYTVTFDSNAGSKVDSQEVLENAKATKPENPTREGYTFVEWQLNKKTYDFNEEVTKNITLKAKWAKVETAGKEENKETEEENATPENNNNESVKEPEKEEPIIIDTTESRIEKINLNENILYYPSGNGFGGGCGVSRYMLFATNLETLFPGYVKNNTISLITQEDIDRTAEEGWELDTTSLLLDTEWDDKYSQITFDSAKEANLIKVFDSLKSSTTASIDGFEYKFENHQLLRYSYGSIRLEETDKFITLNKSLNSIRTKIDAQINSATKGMYIITNYFGGCGSMEPPILLTEEECNQYNLTCERW